MKKTSPHNSTQPDKHQPIRLHRNDGSIQERVRQRAYELYEQRGRGDGRQEEDWAHAEEQIREERSFDKAA
jgi:hypothetical protein